MQKTYNPTRDLEVIFPGGSASKQFHTYIDNIEKEIGNLATLVEQFTTNDPETLEKIIDNLERTVKTLREAGAFISCLSAQNMKDEQADLLVGKRSELSAKLAAVKTKLDQKLLSIDNTKWQEILESPKLKEVAFVLNEYREKAKDQLRSEEQTSELE